MRETLMGGGGGGSSGMLPREMLFLGNTISSILGVVLGSFKRIAEVTLQF